jgi:uncharacterized membrane protein YebE (DUF533 family)
MGTLAKVAIGYATARGVDHMSRNGGLGGLLGGAQVASGEARAEPNPMVAQMQGFAGGGDGGNPMEQMQQMMAGLMGGAGGQSGDATNPAAGFQEMMAGLMGGAGGAGSAAGGGDGLQTMMAGLMGGAAPGGSAEGDAGGGLLSGAGGAGLAGMLAMAGTAGAATGGNAGALMDAFKTEETAPEAEQAAGLMLRAMIQAAKADGDIDAEEQAKIMDLVGDADEADIAFVREQLAAPVDIDALAAATPEMQKMQVYSMSLMSIRVDTPAEAQYLDQLAGKLGLDQQTVNALHAQMGVQPLYS